jgi:hypothetical protein
VLFHTIVLSVLPSGSGVDNTVGPARYNYGVADFYAVVVENYMLHAYSSFTFIGNPSLA